eukprot:gene9038-10709_t
MKRSRDSSPDDHASTTSFKRGEDVPSSINETRQFTDQIVPNACSVEASQRVDLGDDSYTRPDACNSHFFTKETIENSFAQGSTKPARPHQVSAVHRLLGELRKPVGAPPVNFLLQHSTGSGKSLTIACLVHHLRCLSYISEVGKPTRCFGAVIVLNDRIQLDRQLTDTITSFLQRTSSGVDIRHVDTSEELQSALSQLPDAGSPAPAPVLLSTLQKFPSLRRRQASASRGASGSLAGSTAFPRICIVADEAHRSHGKGGTSQLHEALGGQSDQPDFLTYIAFTATPSPQALRLFGMKRWLPALGVGRGGSMHAEFDFVGCTETPAGLRSAALEAKEAEVPAQGADMEEVFEAWDSYSMKQALDDGHVLNVLEDYVTLCPRVEIDSNKDASRPTPGKVAVEVLLEMAARHRAVVDKKAEYIAQHLVAALEHRAEGGFDSARGMLVARSRRHVLWFTQAIRHELQRAGHGAAIKVYGAYSGAVNAAGDEGMDCGDSESPEKDRTGVSCDEDTRSFTEAELNSGRCTLAEAKLLVVCNKFETGFDDPRLALMYVDKPLQGARAVQTLSRLNRAAPHLRKTATSVVDFVNSAGSIAESFEEYFHATQLRESGGPAERRQRELHLDRLLTRLLTALTTGAPLLALVAGLERAVIEAVGEGGGLGEGRPTNRTAAAKEGSSEASADESKVVEAESISKMSLAAVLESTPIELAAQVRLMLPEFQQAVEDDVVTYCAECERLQREKPELPFRFARALREALGSAAGTGRRRSTAEPGHGTEDAEALVGVQVQSLEQTWSGEIVVGRWMVPLRSRKISQFSTSGGGGGGKSQKIAGRGGGMQLQQAIRAANEQLKEGYSKLAVEGLQVMKARLEAALWPAAAEDAKVPSAGGRDGAGGRRCSEDPGAAVAVLQRLQMWDLRTELLSESGIAYTVNRCKKHANPM